jgi:2-polyprenyl-3-methyl-5-hydroxy-6-metoxy-1,4-benzoquinol methylase
MISRIKAILARVLGRGLNLLSPETRADAFMRLIHSSVKHETPESALRFLFELDNRLYALQGEASVRYGDGLHTKHRHIDYHEFFVKNLKPGERVLDIGCGNGFLSYDMATQAEGVRVVGIEMNETNLKFAREHYRHPNLHFIHGDALKDLPDEKFDVVTLSNVLEHIDGRSEFLKKILKQIVPERLIIRVPMFERDWRVPLKKELGMDYRLDQTHCIEYRQEEFFDELLKVGLKPIHTEFRWGEIWSMVEPIHEKEKNV